MIFNRTPELNAAELIEGAHRATAGHDLERIKRYKDDVVIPLFEELEQLREEVKRLKRQTLK